MVFLLLAVETLYAGLSTKLFATLASLFGLLAGSKVVKRFSQGFRHRIQ